MEGRNRIVIEAVTPQIDCGRYPVKRIAGEEMVVQADVFSDGHDEVAANLLYRKQGAQDWQDWQEVPMKRLGDDRWQGTFLLAAPGMYQYTITGCVDHFRSWQKELSKKQQAGQDIAIELQIGVDLIEKAATQSSPKDAARLGFVAEELKKKGDLQHATALGLDPEVANLIRTCSAPPLVTRYPKDFPVEVERQKALFSSWYELFPRSCASEPRRHGTFRDCAKRIPEIAEMGFDVLYLPPIHPIGSTKRRGKNNASVADPDDPGCPWAIGNLGGGHKEVHPDLGTMEDFQYLIEEAEQNGMELALDLAFQCSPDHPYIKEHPEWFLWRPDGTVQFSENPPKKYEDIVPLNFETENWRELWEELKSVVFFWMDKGIMIFRVDNPHTKPFSMWEWLIREAKQKSPDVIFLAEAFTRPKVMYQLAKLGFSQSYSYFTWRSTGEELTEYMTQLTRTEVSEFFRPNFWPNTPDILSEHLQYGGKAAFMIRFILAATLSSNYGIYGPVYELCIADGIDGKEEYLNSEKYEAHNWNHDAPGNIKKLITAVNRIRNENAAFRETANISFYPTDDENILFYGKSSCDRANVVLVAVNLDTQNRRTAKIRIPVEEFGIEPGRPYLVNDLLGKESYVQQGDWISIELDPLVKPAVIFRIRTRLHREADFDYYL